MVYCADLVTAGGVSEVVRLERVPAGQAGPTPANDVRNPHQRPGLPAQRAGEAAGATLNEKSA